MTRQITVPPKANGRPYISAYDDLAKTCESCGAIFRLRDRPFQSFNKFMARRFCSQLCAGIVSSDPDIFFWRRVRKGEPQQCWEWAGKITRKGYGELNVKGKRWRAHRFSYALEHGTVPDELMVLHSCDNRRCVNPAHLRVGTGKDNVADAVSRGRMAWQKKEAA